MSETETEFFSVSFLDFQIFFKNSLQLFVPATCSVARGLTCSSVNVGI